MGIDTLCNQPSRSPGTTVGRQEKLLQFLSQGRCSQSVSEPGRKQPQLEQGRLILQNLLPSHPASKRNASVLELGTELRSSSAPAFEGAGGAGWGVFISHPAS